MTPHNPAKNPLVRRRRNDFISKAAAILTELEGKPDAIQQQKRQQVFERCGIWLPLQMPALPPANSSVDELICIGQLIRDDGTIQCVFVKRLLLHGYHIVRSTGGCVTTEINLSLPIDKTLKLLSQELSGQKTKRHDTPNTQVDLEKRNRAYECLLHESSAEAAGKEMALSPKTVLRYARRLEAFVNTVLE